jgi:AcrR family transcriptional regulator
MITVGLQERRERERQATQQAILEAALEIASQDGWQAVTMRRVAKQIEYSPSAIYKYFEEKETIFQTLLIQGFQQLLTVLERIAAQESDPSERVLQIAAAYWDFVWQHPTVYQLMFDLQGRMHEIREAKATFLIVRTVIAEWSQANQASIVDLDAAVEILWATMHGLVALTMSQHIAGGPTRGKALLFQTVNMLLLAWKTPAHS